MNRREFTKTIAASAVGLRLAGSGFGRTNEPPQFAITMDDFNRRNPVHLTVDERNRRILSTLSANRIKTALFVEARNVDSQEGMTLLRRWDEASH